MLNTEKHSKPKQRLEVSDQQTSIGVPEKIYCTFSKHPCQNRFCGFHMVLKALETCTFLMFTDICTVFTEVQLASTCNILYLTGHWCTADSL